MPYAVGIDVGGTHVKAASVSEAGDVLDRAEARTRDGEPGAFVEAARVLLGELESRRAEPASWIGVAAPGVAARDGRAVASMPAGKLAGLQGLVWQEALAARAPVRVLNDAHAALLGEAWKGAAAGARDAVLLTLGTGVGGAILSGGRLLEGHLGRAGHFGHLCLDPDGRASIAGMPGGLEVVVGNGTVAERSGGRFRDTRALVAAHLAGDHDASAVWLRSVWVLACAIASIVNAVDPEVVILGGGVALAGPALFDPLARDLDRVEWRPLGRAVRVVPAALGDLAGALGAARRAMEAAGPSAGPAAEYLQRCHGLVEVVAAQQGPIARAADLFAGAILAGRMVHVFGSGHSRIMVEETWPRYGSFPGFNPIVELSLTHHAPVVGANGQRQAMFLENVPGLAERILRNFDIRPPDAALVVSSSGCNVVSVEMAEGFRARGLNVVAVVSRRHCDASRSRHPRGLKLPDVSDVVLDTGAPPGDAMVSLPGLTTPVSPGSTVGGCLLVNAVKAEVAARLVRAGHPPTVLTAPAIVGAEASEALFESAYDEHARRLARLYAGLGSKGGAG